MIIVTDVLKEPLDEGAKVAVRNLLVRHKENHPCTIVGVNSPGSPIPPVDTRYALNKLLLSIPFYRYLRNLPYATILYIPEASITPATFVRAWLLRRFTGKAVTILSLQPRSYSPLAAGFIRTIKPEKIITQSAATATALRKLGICADSLPLGIDIEGFREVVLSEKNRLRDKYGIDRDAKVLLHVGHVRTSRNLEWLVEIKRLLPDLCVVVVGSTTTDMEADISRRLIANGVTVLREYLPHIEELYQLSDYYIFPVLKDDAAIETPLSVLEAMATNLPVLSTRFGSLTEMFQEDEHFKFVANPEKAAEHLKNGFSEPCRNREKVLMYGWERIAERLAQMV